MDVVWMVGLDGPWDHWELRFSMRSFWANYQTAAKLWIIGHVPAWVDRAQVHCIDWPDPFRRCKDANLMHKALRLALESGLSDPFVLCSDDHLLLKPSAPANFKTWSEGQLSFEVLPGANGWQQRLVRTAVALRKAGFPTARFDCHLPYPLRKAWIREALRFDFSTKPGMCVFSTILNVGKAPAIPIGRRSVRGWMGDEKTTSVEVDQVLGDFRFACLSSASIRNPCTVQRLSALFPQVAPWELFLSELPAPSEHEHERSDVACVA